MRGRDIMGILKPSKNNQALRDAFSVKLDKPPGKMKAKILARKTEIETAANAKITRQPNASAARKLKAKEVTDPKKGHKDTRKPAPKKGSSG